MKTKIQQAADYSLHIQLDQVEVTNGVRVQLMSYFDSAKNPLEPRVGIDLHMSQEEFELLRQAVNNFTV